MTATDMFQATMSYVEQLAPFALVFAVIACGEELAGLIKRVIISNRKKSW